MVRSLPAVLVAVLFGLLGMAIAEAQGQRVSTVAEMTARIDAPLVIGHRGAPGYRPEHTLASYALAIDLGVDFIEPDLVSTKDGVLIARHENEISGTTDVAQKFPDRKTTQDDRWQDHRRLLHRDFTLAEIKTLRAKERLPFRNQGWNGFYEIPTLDEVIDLAQRRSRETGRIIGIYPETKHPSYFRSIGLALESPLVKALAARGYTHANAPVFIQSFEVQNLKDLRKLTQGEAGPAHGERARAAVRLHRRRRPAHLRRSDEAGGLAEIATYAQGIGPFKRSIVPQGPDGRLRKPTSLVADAHRAGLVVHPYTFRDEPEFLAPDYESRSDQGVPAVL